MKKADLEKFCKDLTPGTFLVIQKIKLKFKKGGSFGYKPETIRFKYYNDGYLIGMDRECFYYTKIESIT